MFTNFNIDNKFEIFETIKKFIFDTFENIYKKGNKYFLTENLNAEDIKTNNINIFTLNTKFTDIIDNINKKIMIEFNSNKKFLKLKYIFENLINEKKYESFKSIKTRLVEGIKKYEKYYNRKLVEKEIDSIYKDMELICKHYNNLVEKYKNSGIKSKEAQNDFNDIKKKVQSYIDSKDAYYEGSFFNFFKSKEGKVQIIDRNEYIDKKEKEINIDKFEIIFGEEIGIIEFFDEFENIIQKIEEILTLVKISNKSNIEQLISKLNKFKRFTEPKKEMFKIDIKDKDIYEKFISEGNIDINRELNITSILLDSIIVSINEIMNEYYCSRRNEHNIKLLKEMKNELKIYIPEINKLEYINNRKIKDEQLIIKDNANNIIPYYTIINDN